jgi:hypothetical protein
MEFNVMKFFPTKSVFSGKDILIIDFEDSRFMRMEIDSFAVRSLLEGFFVPINNLSLHYGESLNKIQKYYPQYVPEHGLTFDELILLMGTEI